MQQRRGDKPVVYLDQNWISNLTKSYMHDWNSSEKAYYQGLSSAIQEGVASGRFVCPTSSFHESEASYGSIVKNSLLYVASELSRGLHFNSPIHINHQQLLRAASEFAEQDVPDYPWWTVPFNRDPDCRLDASPEKTIQVHLSIDEFATEAKRIRDGAQITQYQAFKKERRQRNLGFEAEVDWVGSNSLKRVVWG